jgi:hypothetical protein
MINETKWEIESETDDKIVLRKKRDDWGDCDWVVASYGEPNITIIKTIHHRKFYNIWPSKELAEKAALMMRSSNALIWAKLRVEPEFEPDWSDGFQEKWCPSTGECWLNREEDGLQYYSTKEKATEARQLLIDAGVWEAGD